MTAYWDSSALVEACLHDLDDFRGLRLPAEIQPPPEV